jgi:hypothetical protein
MLSRHRISENVARIVCAAVLWLGACSNIPPAEFPAFTERAVAAEFVVPADGRLMMPHSSWLLVVQELEADPAPQAERFDGGTRWFVYPAGTAVRVRCRYRAYAEPGGRPAEPADVLSGASSIRALEEP